jgi:hypothetical protein
MKTELIKIKDFAIGDRFIHYGAILEVTSEVRVWADGNRRLERIEITDDPSKWEARSCYGRKCKYIKPEEGEEGQVRNLGGLITGYDWMQGIEEVKYAKIVNN